MGVDVDCMFIGGVNNWDIDGGEFIFEVGYGMDLIV